MRTIFHSKIGENKTVPSPVLSHERKYEKVERKVNEEK